MGGFDAQGPGLGRGSGLLTGRNHSPDNAALRESVTVAQNAQPIDTSGQWLTMTARSAVRLLLVLVLGLPLIQAVLAWVSGLLGAMGDAAAAGVLDHINTGARVAWLVCLVGLVVILALRSLEEPPSAG